VIALVFVYYPELYPRLSFLNGICSARNKTYVGMDNYRTVLEPGSDFWETLLITLIRLMY
jgi:ABC-type sugar transport system permease subunit